VVTVAPRMTGAEEEAMGRFLAMCY